METKLSWVDSYEIACLLRIRHPLIDLHDVSLGDIHKWTLALPEFTDEAQNATDRILMDIFCELLEEDLSK
jgi:FeS assembly protein IscX